MKHEKSLLHRLALPVCKICEDYKLMKITASLTSMKRPNVILILLLGFAVPVSGRAQAEETHEFDEYSGVIGDLPVGMVLSISDGTITQGSHYYYRKYLKDIPLKGVAAGELHLTEPGGGTFILHYIDNKSTPVSADNSTGLMGTWANNAKTLPVKLTHDGAGNYAPGHRYADLTNEGDAHFEARIQGFYDGVLANKPDATSQSISFPLRVNTPDGHYMIIHNATELKQKWGLIFSAAWLRALAATSPHDLPVLKGHAMIGAGLAFFGPKGLEVVNTIR